MPLSPTRTLLLALLCLLITPPLAAASAEPAPVILASPPANLRVDGDLAEWSSRPGFSPLALPFVQVAGKSPVEGERDFSAEVFVALGSEGLALAGRVRDDRVLFPAGDPERLSSDHVELWLALPGLTPDFPRIEKWEPASAEAPESDPAVWQTTQELYQRYLERLFVRQYSFSTLGVAEHYQSAVEVRETFALPFPADVELGAAKAVFLRTAPGYAFEAWLPIASFPATAELPLGELRLLVDVVDNDAGYRGQESFFSLAPRRRFGDPATFLTVRPQSPLRLPSPDHLAELLLGLEPRSRFVLPSANLEQAYALVDLEIEGEEPWPWPGPNGHPPFIFALPLALREVARSGNFELGIMADDAWVAFGYDGEVMLETWRLVSHDTAGWRASTAVGLVEGCPSAEVTGEGYACRVVNWQRPPGLHVAMADVTTSSPVGRGTCGACPVVEISIVGVGPEGQLGELFREGVGGGLYGWMPHWVPQEARGRALAEVAALLYPGEPDAVPWLTKNPRGKARLPADFDLAFIAGEPWTMAEEDQQETKIELTTITWDAAAGRYVTTSLEL